MSLDPGFGPKQEEDSKPKTLGQTIFTEDIHPFIRATFPAIRNARCADEIVKEIFVLKLFYNQELNAYTLKKIFRDLMSPSLPRAIEEWMQQVTKISDDPPLEIRTIESNKYTKKYRELIGSIALEVFFEAIFERNRDLFWEWLSNLGDLGIWHSPERKFAPIALGVFLEYFATCNEETKKNFKGQIRKFLKHVLEEPLTPYPLGKNDERTKVDISQWAELQRRLLANALVANGMYEECVEYDLPEAILPLKLKFLGSAFTETDDGLIAISHTGKTMDAKMAMEKACNDREWRHIWSVLSIMECHYSKAYFINIVDPRHVHPQSQSKISRKLALVFMNGFEDGLQGF